MGCVGLSEGFENLFIGTGPKKRVELFTGKLFTWIQYSQMACYDDCVALPNDFQFRLVGEVSLSSMSKRSPFLGRLSEGNDDSMKA